MTFLHFAETAERVGATTKRLEKAAVLGVYFGGLSDDDLAHAARYLAGYTFPLRDQRTTNVGGAALLTAILAVTGADETNTRERLVALGDAGDVAYEAFAASPQVTLAPSLTLAQVAAFLETLAGTSGTKRKGELVTSLLRGATPLEAKYVVKLLAGDLRIGLKEGAVEDAIARLASVPVGKVQWTNMLTGDVGETALLARRGELGQAVMRLFHPLKFMLATPAADLADVARQMPTPFVVEDKFDGIRAQAHIAPHVPGDDVLHGVVFEGRRVALFSRTLDEITESFPDLVAPLARLLAIGFPPAPNPGGVGEDIADGTTGSCRTPPGLGAGGLILDGEIIPIQGDQTLPFLQLQKRLGRKTLTDALRAEVPVAFVAYDALYGEGRVLIEDPFSQRRSVLETLPVDGAATRRAASALFTDVTALDDAFDAARARGNEGLMVKDPASPYKPGRRGRDWLKIKRALATLDVVVTAAQVGEGRRSKFLSDFTFAVRASETDPSLLNVGKAYSGLTDVEVGELSEWFKAHTLQEFAHGKVRTVEPKIVLEVTFDRVQASTRHKSGYALRFPRILRIRHDKPAEEIDTLETVRRLAEEGEGGVGALLAAPSSPAAPLAPGAQPPENPPMTLTAPPNPTPDLAAARLAFTDFVLPTPRDARVVALHDSDADGVSAGVVWQRGMERLGFTNVLRLLPDRERSAWSEGNRATLAAAKPDRLFILDLGSQPHPVLPGVPTCFVDHHRPEGVPAGDTLVSAYAWDPIPTTSGLTWDVFSPLTDVVDLDWIAAVGVLGDLGDSAPFDVLTEAKRKYTARYLKETVALINAARRASSYDPESAARALLSHPDPRAFVNSDSPDVAAMRVAREHVKAAMEEAKKAAPVFAGQVALIRVHSDCQIHPLVAQIWRTRLPKFIVIAANDAYLPGKVNFSARGAKGVNVLEFLRSVPLPPGEGNFGHGHDAASGGSLPVARWNLLLGAMGFAPDVFAAEG